MHTCFLTPSCSKSPYVMLNFRRERAGILLIYFLDLFGSFSCGFLKSRVLIMIQIGVSLFDLTHCGFTSSIFKQRNILMLILLLYYLIERFIVCVERCQCFLQNAEILLHLKVMNVSQEVLLTLFLSVNIQILILTPSNFELIFISMRYVKVRGGPGLKNNFPSSLAIL